VSVKKRPTINTVVVLKIMCGWWLAERNLSSWIPSNMTQTP
jgi:hypothetical protein